MKTVDETIAGLEAIVRDEMCRDSGRSFAAAAIWHLRRMAKIEEALKSMEDVWLDGEGCDDNYFHGFKNCHDRMTKIATAALAHASEQEAGK